MRTGRERDRAARAKEREREKIFLRSTNFFPTSFCLPLSLFFDTPPPKEQVHAEISKGDEAREAPKTETEGTLIDWTSGHVNKSNNGEPINLAFAPEAIVSALRGTPDPPLWGSDHRPHAITIAFPADAEEMELG